MSVTLVKHYNPAWPSWFEELRHRFDSVLSGRYCSIEHVGSTSVAGMTAKPIIDVDIVIEPQDFESQSAYRFHHQREFSTCQVLCHGRK